ncbi:MAG: hypothetical protein LBM77_05975 [Spirochaetaceae bacterium]|jgi:hypothetical protein|nr:hypothetical protein [Spirochaetaceae bacterium]
MAEVLQFRVSKAVKTTRLCEMMMMVAVMKSATRKKVDACNVSGMEKPAFLHNDRNKNILLRTIFLKGVELILFSEGSETI